MTFILYNYSACFPNIKITLLLVVIADNYFYSRPPSWIGAIYHLNI